MQNWGELYTSLCVHWHFMCPMAFYASNNISHIKIKTHAKKFNFDKNLPNLLVKFDWTHKMQLDALNVDWTWTHKMPLDGRINYLLLLQNCVRYNVVLLQNKTLVSMEI